MPTLTAFTSRWAKSPTRANRCLALLSKAFNLAEVWGWRRDGTNPCRHVRKFAEAKAQEVLVTCRTGAAG